LDGSTYKVVKVSSVKRDTTYAARASHILLRWSDDSEAAKKEAKEKARNILKEIKAGADFAAKAREHGTDGTASQGGDLGWFTSGQMVKPFEKAVFDATKTGVLNDVIETDFGYHIISVTNTKDNRAYELAVIEREITPSDASINESLRKAESFATDLSGIENFTKRAEENGLTVYDAKNITPSERRMNNLGEARQAVQWLFRDGEIGKVSEVFDLQDVYVVAVMTGEVKKGYKPLELIKDEIAMPVKNEVKGKKIIDKLSTLNGSLAEVAAAFGNDATVQSMSDLRLSTNNLTMVGLDPQAVGVAFSPEGGNRTKPFAGERGVLIAEMKNKTIAPAIADYTAYKNQLLQSGRYRTMSSSMADAIKDKANIEDNRYKFY
jgi:peptidyl-prolyl cis-trans isomerase D